MIKKLNKEYYDWNQLCREVKTLSGRDIRDWLGKYNKKVNYETGDFTVAHWATKHGYNWKVLIGEVKGAELEERIKINTEYAKADDGQCLEPKYIDFWHFIADTYEIHNGSYIYFNPYELKEELSNYSYIENHEEEKEYLEEILNYFIRVFEINNMENEIEVYISW